MTDAAAHETDVVADAFARTAWPGQLRRQQREALDALSQRWADGQRRSWLVLPPGTGKTLVGLEAARRLGRRTIVFGPNTAIQAQWVEEWDAFAPPVVTVGNDRNLQTMITALTYQSLAVFDPDAETDEEGHVHVEHGGPPRRGKLMDRLHPNGQQLIETMRDADGVTLVLDEAHHLLEVWGRLVAELLEVLGDAYVIGLTATPPATLTATQEQLVRRLFGTPAYQASVPAVVRDGYLAPFAELSFLVTPTATEGAWLAAETERFAELRTDLVDPQFATVTLFEWLDRRFVRRTGDEGSTLSWRHVERNEPELAGAALRLHVAGLLGLPAGARIREEHRHEPSAADWVAVLNDYVRGFLSRSADPQDAAALSRIRKALPSIGYQLTKRGIRSGRSPVDRVLARSEAKTYGVVEVLARESDTLGTDLRALVLCDHERATATLPARLSGVLDAQAGSARLLLENLVADERTRALAPMLVTGSTVAAAAETARAFVAWADADLDPIAGTDTGQAVEITGRWDSRTWVQLVTRFVEEGHTHVLVGTRGLLGEGWNAQGINTLVDLTTATTPTAIVQTRGRALRTDPSRPEKVATNWTVVCVSEEHPGGACDWDRFVRKHSGFLAVDGQGEIVDGVAHVDDTFSPYAPPMAATFDSINARMLKRSAVRADIRDAWKIGTPYVDEFVHELRIAPPTERAWRQVEVEAPARRARAVPGVQGVIAATPAAPDSAPADAASMAADHPYGLPLADRRLQPERIEPDPRRWPLVPLLVGAGSTAAVIASFAGTFGETTSGLSATLALLTLALAVIGGAGVWWERRAGRQRAEQRQHEQWQRHIHAAGQVLTELAEESVDLTRFAYAVADALNSAALSPADSAGVHIEVDATGTYRAALPGVTTEVSEIFATALDEVLSPITEPRYVIPRYVLDPPTDGDRLDDLGRRWLSGQDLPRNNVVYHAVPGALGANASLVAEFQRAWSRWVSAGEALFTGSPEGAGILAAQRGADPFDVTTVLRVGWT